MMANCKHEKCQPHAVCGQFKGDDENSGGNIYTTGHLQKHKGHELYGWPWYPGPLNRAVNTLSDGVVVEIGVFGGASLLSIVDSCIKTNSHIYGIDPWEKVNTGNGAFLPEHQKKIYRASIKKVRLNLEKIIRAQGYDNITLMHDFATNVVSQFEDESIDVLLIDGDHSYDSVYEDLTLWMPKVRPGGSVWGDDFNLTSVQKAAQDFCTKHKMKLQMVKPGRVWYTNKS